MVDPVSILSIIAMLINTIIVFSQGIEDLCGYYEKMQSLWDELIALQSVLSDLLEACETDANRFLSLSFPLERCNHTCVRFSEVIKKCTAHSNGSRPSGRDWAAIKWNSDEIDNFLRTLDSYKMTICISLWVVNMYAHRLYRCIAIATVTTLMS